MVKIIQFGGYIHIHCRQVSKKFWWQNLFRGRYNVRSETKTLAWPPHKVCQGRFCFTVRISVSFRKKQKLAMHIEATHLNTCT